MHASSCTKRLASPPLPLIGGCQSYFQDIRRIQALQETDSRTPSFAAHVAAHVDCARFRYTYCYFPSGHLTKTGDTELVLQSWMTIKKRQHQETYANISDVRLDI